MGLISAKSSSQIIRFLKSDSASRILGWFLLPVGSFGLLLDLEQFGGINVAYGVLTAISLWLIIRAAGIWDVSDSRELMLRHASGRRHAKHVHHTPKVRLFNPQQLRVVIVSLLLFGAACLAIGANLLFAASPSLFLVAVEGLAIAVMLLAGKNRRGWFLIASATAATTLLTSITFLSPPDSYLNERLLSSYLAVAYLGVTYWVVAGWQRTVENNRMGLTLIFASALVYLTLIGSLANYPLRAAWLVSFVSLAGVSLAFAAAAWIKVSRQSFAKFFLAVTMASVMLWAYLYLSETSVILMLLAGGLTSLAVGVWGPTYSARMIGASAIALGTLHYLLMLQSSYDISVYGPIWTHTTVWLGSITLAVLGTAYWWYGAALSVLKPKETLLQPVIRRSIATAAWGIILVILVQEGTGITQTILFAVWGIWLYALSRMHGEKVGLVAGVAAVVLAAFQFLAVDMQTFTRLEQAIGFIGFAIFILLCSLYVAQHYLSHKKTHR